MTLGFSPCPNDTFIFDALVNGHIDTEGLSFDVVLEDVQTLNQWALEGRLDVSKISYGVLPLILDKYKVLNSGGALGMGVGPLLITKNGDFNINKINEARIAIPGKNTTAHLLFSLAFPQAHNKTFHVFHEIEDLVLSGAVDAGVIIHENRFTYHLKGLHKLMDLGNYWETKTGSPIPLGGIVTHNRLPKEISQKMNRLIQKSLAYAFNQSPHLSDYVRMHAQEMSEEVMRQHIHLYVNDFSMDVGDSGKLAVNQLLSIAQSVITGFTTPVNSVFLD